MCDENPGEQRHREGFDQPVDPDRCRNSAPVLPDLAKGGEIDLEQHRHNHQPDENGDRDVDLRDGCLAEHVKGTRKSIDRGRCQR